MHIAVARKLENRLLGDEFYNRCVVCVYETVFHQFAQFRKNGFDRFGRVDKLNLHRQVPILGAVTFPGVPLVVSAESLLRLY